MGVKMRSSYLPEDVVLLLKDITGLVQPQPTEEREKLIQSGRHYSEMLPVEYVPTEKYMEVYREALGRYAKQVADAVALSMVFCKRYCKIIRKFRCLQTFCFFFSVRCA